MELINPEDSRRKRREPIEHLGGRRLRVLTSAWVASELTGAIRRGELAAGEQVNQQRWADRLDVSRAVLREGMEVVATQNLLRHDRNRGYFVSTMTTQQMSQLYWLRVNVERELLLSIRQASESELALIHDAGERAIAGYLAKDPSAMFDAEREMFFDIYALAPFDFLATEAARLWDLASIFRLSVARERMAEVHASPPRYEDRKRSQILAVERHDTYSLTESVVLERRMVVDHFLNNDLRWHAGGSVTLVPPGA